MTGGTAQSTTTSERPRPAPPSSALPRPMPLLTSTIDPGSDAYRQNRAAMESALAEVEEQLAVARAGGGERYVERHREPGQAARPRAGGDCCSTATPPSSRSPPWRRGGRTTPWGPAWSRASAW